MEKKQNREEVFKKAISWAMENLPDKKVYQKDIKDFIQFNRVGLNHSIYAKTYDEKIEMIYSAVKLIEQSTLCGIEKDKRGRIEIKAIYKLVSNWKCNGKEYFVYIIVRETRQGKFYYDHGIIKEKP